MSIATLKKKSQIYFNPISSSKLFSINSTLRNQGWVGQTSLSRSNTRGLKKGNDYVGHGGSHGSYPISNLSDGIFSNSSPSVIKTIKNTNGLLLSKIIHPTSVYNSNVPTNLSLCNIVKQDDTNYNTHYDDNHLRKIKLKHICTDTLTPQYKTNLSCSSTCSNRKVRYDQFVKKHQTMSSHDYVLTRVLLNNCVPVNP